VFHVDPLSRCKSAVTLSQSKRGSQSPQSCEEGNENDESGSENKRLSAWEQWILKKAKEERDKLELELEKMRIENENAEKLRQEKEKKRLQAQETIQAWIEEHDTVVKQRLQLAAQRRQAEKELKEAKKKEVQIKAQENFKVASLRTSCNSKHVLFIL
jgi:hypothetical protein